MAGNVGIQRTSKSALMPKIIKPNEAITSNLGL
jgi:hypothetical protein